MTKVHEINLNTKLWNFFQEHDFIILDLTDKQINEQDYVLFKQVSLDEGKETDTGLFRMTQIRSITTNDGFKEGPYLHSKMNQLAQEVNARLDGQTVAPSTPSAPSGEKYSVGLPICTNTLSVNCYGTGKVYKGDWNGTIGRVIKGAKYPYRVDRNGVAIGWTNNTGIDSDPHIPGGTTTSTPTVLNSTPSDFIRENATFYPNTTLKIRKAPTEKGIDTGLYYSQGMSVQYDGYVKREGLVWISWISASTGERRWMKAGVLNSKGYNTNPYGRFA